ncbi:MAG: ATP-binding cassette domain-containing protein [Methanomassiliicoccaceae archaeon]|jgi:ABC-type lipoprotein export system ATPase subunit|nr:ATP-binding cassette domain-containing protein [Methanomassiliicoccaceae archaeon]
MSWTREIREITILPGTTKAGEAENFKEITIRPGDTISVVGPTGSGKTALINDIEVFAQGDTITKRRILVNGDVPPDEYIRDPAYKPIALITQNTKCLADLFVKEFIEMHITARNSDESGLSEKVIELANKFTGENITAGSRMTSLSGGQTRSLMIADAILISNAPILLLDEIENAGIFKEEVIKQLRKMNKAVIFVTHDPYISLLSDRRIIMGNGEVRSVMSPHGMEEGALKKISEMDRLLSKIREKIRVGDMISGDDL